MSNLIGPDISFYQDNNDTPVQVNFATMLKSAGYVIIRAGQNQWVDPDFAFNWQESKKIGLPRGSYWFYDSRVDPETQAALWVQQFLGDYGELPLFPDFEEHYGGPYGGWKNFKIFLEALKKLVPGKEICIYTAFYYWQDLLIPQDEVEYFHQYSLWIANYEVQTPRVPAPWGTGEWLFWQWTDKGSGKLYGVESANVDLNYFNGDSAAFALRFKLLNAPLPVPDPSEQNIQTHAGVTIHIVQRFGCKCVIHIIDPKIARVFVTPGGYRPVGVALASYGAQIGVNGGGWPNINTVGQRSNEIWVSDGNIIQPTAIDNRGFINVAKDGIVTVHEHADSAAGMWNAWGFDRILGKDGVFNPLISDRTVKDARTGSGATSDGKLIILSAEGNDRYMHGLSFPEMWSVLSEFGAVIAGNNDGGSSSTVINTALSPDSLIVPSDGKQANVINQVLIFSSPSNNIPDPTPAPIPNPIPDTGNPMRTYKVIRPARLRSIYSLNTNDTGASSVIGEVFTSPTDPRTDPHNSTVTMVQRPDLKWIPLSVNGVIYTELVSEVTPPVDPGGVLEVISSTITIKLPDGSVKVVNMVPDASNN